MTHRINASPEPAKRGDTVTFTYNTDGCTEWPIVVRVFIDYELGHVDLVLKESDVPPDGPATVVIGAMIVPSTCTGLLATDQTGQSLDCPVTVTP